MVRRAFTLVELLVVIGIIAVLIGILLPVLSGARQQANLIKCASNLRQLTSTAVIHAQEHQGYMPLAGDLVLQYPGASGDFRADLGREAVSLGDAGRRRYSYMNVSYAGDITGLMGYTSALAQYFSPALKLATDDTVHYLEMLSDPDGPWKYFMCPGTDSFNSAQRSAGGSFTSSGRECAVLSVTYTNGNGDFSFWVDADYLVNEGVLGYSAMPNKRRLQGKLAAVRQPSLTFFAMDGKADMTASYRWLTFAPLNETGDGRAHNLGENFNEPTDQRKLDFVRHKKRTNISFCDGHVEAVNLTAPDLARIYLLPPMR